MDQQQAKCLQWEERKKGQTRGNAVAGKDSNGLSFVLAAQWVNVAQKMQTAHGIWPAGKGACMSGGGSRLIDSAWAAA